MWRGLCVSRKSYQSPLWYTCLLQVETIEKRCLELFGRDYKYSVIHNANGEVCGHYPRQMVFLEYECTELRKDGYRTYLRYLNTSSLRLCLQILDLLDVQSLFPQSLFPQLLSKHIGGGGPREGPWILSTNVLWEELKKQARIWQPVTFSVTAGNKVQST